MKSTISRLLSLLLALSLATPALAQLPRNMVPQEASYSTVDLASPVNWNSPLNRGALAWYLELPQLNQAGSVWRNIAQRGANGTLTSMAIPATSTSGRGRTTARGAYGELRFDGSNDQVNTGLDPYPRAIFNSGLTMATWLKQTVTPAGTTTYLISIEGAYGTSTKATGKFACGIDGTGVDVSTTASIVNNVWTHFACTATGSGALRLYVNGVLDATGTQSYYDINSLNRFISIGGHPTSACCNFTGAMHDVRIANRAYAAQEVLALFQEGPTAFPTTLNRLSLVAKAPTGGAPPPTHRFFPWFGKLLLPANDYERTYLKAVGE